MPTQVNKKEYNHEPVESDGAGTLCKKCGLQMEKCCG
jgi:hypothetical protein